MDEREQLVALRRLKELQDKETADMGRFEKAGRAALGKADELTRIVAGRLNPIVALNTLATGIDARDGTFLSEDAISKLQEKNKRFTEDSVPGKLASFVTEGVLTGPAGKIGSAVKGLGSRLGGSTLAKALTGRTAQRFAEGAATEAAIADTEDAGTAGVLSAALGKFGDALGSTFKGVAKKSQEAANLEALASQAGTELQIPLGQAAESGPVKSFFQKVLPSLPGAQRKIAQQQKASDNTIQELANSYGQGTVDIESILGPGSRTPSELEKEISWLTLGTGMGPINGSTIIGGSRGLSAAPVQKALMGEFSMQKEMAKLLKKAEKGTGATRRTLASEEDKK